MAESGIYISDYSLLTWPDNTTGKATSYSTQRTLYCPAGMEPSQTSITPLIYGCTQCRVGYYSPDVSPDACLECPSGADCNDVGVAIPCVSSGYWRALPGADEDLGDFDKYPLYSCDVVEACISGCQFNDTCAEGRVGTSVTCGVCVEGYYLNYRGGCMECSDKDVYGYVEVIMIYAGAMVLVGLLYLLVVSIWVRPEVLAMQEDTANENNMMTRGTESGRSALSVRMIRAVTVVKKNTVEKVSPENARELLITCKIVLAFLQVMSAFSMLELHDMPSTFKDMAESYHFNPFHGNEDIVSCSSISDTIPTYYFIVLNCLLLPLIIVGMMGSISTCLYRYHHVRMLKIFREDGGRASTGLTPQQSKACEQLSIKLATVFRRLILWLCLVFYPSICSIVLSVFNCRNFGESGVWLRVDNDINCENESYTVFVVLASMGVVIYVLGVPGLFYYAIKNRHEPVWSSSAKFLHHGFVNAWIYYEIVDLTRKLLITSVSQFVASPSSPSQVLFMLVVNSMALFLQSSARPYLHPNDSNLSVLLTSVECCFFLIALIMVSGINESEGYSSSHIFNTLVAMLVFSLFVVTPYTLATKIDFFRLKINVAKQYLMGWWAPALSRVRTSNSLAQKSSVVKVTDDVELPGRFDESKVDSPLHSRVGDVIK